MTDLANEGDGFANWQREQEARIWRPRAPEACEVRAASYELNDWVGRRGATIPDLEQLAERIAASVVNAGKMTRTD